MLGFQIVNISLAFSLPKRPGCKTSREAEARSAKRLKQLTWRTSAASKSRRKPSKVVVKSRFKFHKAESPVPCIVPCIVVAGNHSV
jgi:hypothetical protein